MWQIWKHVLSLESEQKIRVSKNFKILTAQLQRDKLCLWVENQGEGSQLLSIFIIPTGSPVKYCGLNYISTIQWDGLVFHVYYGVPETASKGE